MKRPSIFSSLPFHFPSMLMTAAGCLLLLVLGFSACDDRPRYNVNVQQPQPSQQTTTAATVTAADGLDLRAVGELVTEVQSPEALEKALNDPEVGINNLDLNEDDKVDYIEVTEFGSGDSRGFSLTTEIAPGEEQEIATISIEKDTENEAYVETYGNRHIYGNNHYYHNRVGLGEVLMWGMLMDSMRRPYVSPYGYGNYPGNWRGYQPDPPNAYNTRVNRTAGSGWQQANQARTSTVTQSPNAGKTATTIKAPLANPTQAQRTFQSRNPSRTVRSGGFGRRTTTSSASSTRSAPSRPSVRSSPSSGSRSSGGK